MISFLRLILHFLFVLLFPVALGVKLDCLFAVFLVRLDCIAMNVPLRTTFAVCHRFWVVVFSLSFVSRSFLISLLISSVTCWLFRNMLFNLHVFVFLTAFFFFFLQLISSLIVWSEKMLDRISVFLNLLRFDLWPKMWSILVNVPCALEKRVNSSAFVWNVLKIISEIHLI